jgi:hypothetical protein
MEDESPPEECDALLADVMPDCEQAEECKEGLSEAEPEIDLDLVPFGQDVSAGPDLNWEAMIRRIKPRKPNFPPPDLQRAKIRQLLEILDKEPEIPSEEQIREASGWLSNIEAIIPNHEEFVASGFSLCYPAWHELLKGTNRKSARMILGWIKNGFRPKFVGTATAKHAKRKVLISMLSKVVPGKDIPGLFGGKLPHRVQFQNHQSLFKKWGFSLQQIVKLLETDAAGIWDESEPPVIIYPMGVVDSAGKDMMIVNGRYLNLFLEALPFRYERLRDILAFAKKGWFHGHVGFEIRLFPRANPQGIPKVLLL